MRNRCQNEERRPYSERKQEVHCEPKLGRLGSELEPYAKTQVMMVV